MNTINFDDIAVISRYEGPKIAVDFQHNVLYFWDADTEGDEDYGSVWLVYDLSSNPDFFYSFFQGTASLHDLEIHGRICFGRLATDRKTLNVDDSFAFAWESSSDDDNYNAVTSVYAPNTFRMGNLFQFDCIGYGTVWQAFTIKINGKYPKDADFTDCRWSSFAKSMVAYWNDIYFKQTGYVILDETAILSASAEPFTWNNGIIANLDYTRLPYSNMYFAREGDTIRIQHGSEIWWVPRKIFHELVAGLLEEIAKCHAELRELKTARQIFENYEPAMNVQEEIRTATGLDRYKTPETYQLLETAMQQQNPRTHTLLALARMGFENLGDPDISQILHHINTSPVSSLKTEKPVLKKICARVPGNVRNGDLKNYMQGYYLASFLREYLKLTEMEPLDVDTLVSGLGIEVVSDNFPDNIMALAVWDNGAPRIHLNATVIGSKESLRRSSICHELCHILVDRHFARPLCDLLLSNETYDGVERRARAFAAELLLPRAWAVSFLLGLNDKTDIDQLASHFKVGKELAANQIIDAERTKVIPVPSQSLYAAKKIKSECARV